MYHHYTVNVLPLYMLHVMLEWCKNEVCCIRTYAQKAVNKYIQYNSPGANVLYFIGIEEKHEFSIRRGQASNRNMIILFNTYILLMRGRCQSYGVWDQLGRWGRSESVTQLSLNNYYMFDSLSLTVGSLQLPLLQSHSPLYNITHFIIELH